MPPENAAALDELIGMVTVAGSRQGVLTGGLSGPAASAPGWLGADAVAAGQQVGVVLDLARACQGALVTAGTRLRAHAALLGETRAGIARLRSEQQSDFAAGWRRLAREVDFQQAALSGSPAVQAIVEEVRSADVARRNRHAALLDELSRDAAATGRVLTESSAVVGGRARPGDTNEVIATLAARLPGWGDGELAALGTALAARLFGASLDGAGLDSAAAEMASFADRPAFAEAFLLALGPARMRVLLRLLGNNRPGPGQRAVPAARDGHGGGRSRWPRRRGPARPLPPPVRGRRRRRGQRHGARAPCRRARPHRRSHGDGGGLDPPAGAARARSGFRRRHPHAALGLSAERSARRRHGSARRAAGGRRLRPVADRSRGVADGARAHLG